MNSNYVFQSHDAALICPSFEPLWEQFVASPVLHPGRRNCQSLERALSTLSGAFRDALVELGTRPHPVCFNYKKDFYKTITLKDGPFQNDDLVVLKMRHNIVCFDIDVGFNRHDFDCLIGVVLCYNANLFHEINMQCHLATANYGYKHCTLKSMTAPGSYPRWRFGSLIFPSDE